MCCFSQHETEIFIFRISRDYCKPVLLITKRANNRVRQLSLIHYTDFAFPFKCQDGCHVILCCKCIHNYTTAKSSVLDLVKLFVKIKLNLMFICRRASPPWRDFTIWTTRDLTYIGKRGRLASQRSVHPTKFD